MTRRRFNFSFAIIILICMFMSKAHCQTDLPTAQPVPFRMTAILGSNQGSQFAVDNENYRYGLTAAFPYTAYKQVQDYLLDLEPGQNKLLNSEEGHTIAVTFQGKKNDKYDIRIVIQKDGRQLLNSEVLVSAEAPAFFGGPTLANGTLILVFEKREVLL